MIAKLTQAIQAQQKLIDDLTARVAELEAKNCNCRGEQKLSEQFSSLKFYTDNYLSLIAFNTNLLPSNHQQPQRPLDHLPLNLLYIKTVFMWRFIC
jgi:hypothetical protein